MVGMLLILSVIGATAGMFLAQRFLRGRDKNTMAIGCGLIVLLSSTYTLLTATPQSLTYRLHLVTILVAAVGIFVRALRTRRI